MTTTRKTATFELVEDHEPSYWLKNTLDAIGREVAAGTFTTCGHRAPWSVAAYALWRPGLIVCGRCVSTLRVYGAADRTCDRCGVVALVVHPSVVKLGGIAVMFGLCHACNEAEAAS